MIDKIRLQDGSIAHRVGKVEYRKYEQIRNYILRTRYERGTSLGMAMLKAMCRFHIDENEVRKALFEWRRWFYGNGVRHRPIEMFIKDDKERLAREELEREFEKWKGDENGQVHIDIS